MASFQQTSEVKKSVTTVTSSLRHFSTSILSLYEENRVDWRAENASEINRLRDLIAGDASSYAERVVPKCTSLMQSVDDFFDLFQYLELSEWSKIMKHVTSKAKECASQCSYVLRDHEVISGRLIARRIVARNLEDAINEVIDINKNNEKKLKTIADDNERKAFWSVFVPFVSLPLVIHFAGKSDEASAKAEFHSSQLTINKSALSSVTDVMIPALDSMINALEVLKSYFSNLGSALEQCERQLSLRNKIPELAVASYRKMRIEGQDLKPQLKLFYSTLPEIRTTLLAIGH